MLNPEKKTCLSRFHFSPDVECIQAPWAAVLISILLINLYFIADNNRV